MKLSEIPENPGRGVKSAIVENSALYPHRVCIGDTAYIPTGMESPLDLRRLEHCESRSSKKVSKHFSNTALLELLQTGFKVALQDLPSEDSGIYLKTVNDVTQSIVNEFVGRVSSLGFIPGVVKEP
jgi:hypothetical protein